MKQCSGCIPHISGLLPRMRGFFQLGPSAAISCCASPSTDLVQGHILFLEQPASSGWPSLRNKAWASWPSLEQPWNVIPSLELSSNNNSNKHIRWGFYWDHITAQLSHLSHLFLSVFLHKCWSRGQSLVILMNLRVGFPRIQPVTVKW